MATIKKLILLAFTALVIVGCDVKQSDGTYRVSFYRTYIIDSCEYIGLVENSYFDYLAHKGSCCFCKERRQKELEELVIKLKEK